MTAQIKNSDTAKMSHIGKVPKKAKSKRRKLLRAVLWTLIVLVVLIGIVLALIWHNRTSLMESQIRKLMAKQGYDVVMEITKLSKTQAVTTNIVASKDGAVFFKAERAIVDYDIGKRMAQRIELHKPYINVEVDTQGNVLSSWMPQNPESGSGGDQKLLMPPNGLIIKDATVDWRLMQDKGTQMGSGHANVSADIAANTSWNANLMGTKAVFSSDILTGDITHDVFIETKDGQTFDVFGSVGGKALSTAYFGQNYLRSEDLESQFKLNITRAQIGTKPEISGWYTTRINGLSLPDYAVRHANIKISNFKRAEDNKIHARWQMGAKGVQISNLDMRSELADKLTSHSAMSNIPIAKYFTRNLNIKAAQLLGGFDMAGQGSFGASKAGYVLELAQPLNLQTENQAIVFTRENSGFFGYNKSEQEMTLNADIDWSGVQGLKLTDFSMAAKSFKGTRIDALREINTHVKSSQDWRLHNDGDDVRLAPIDIDFHYEDKGKGLRSVNISGALDYDGPVPGGSVLGLKAEGDMRLRLSGDDFTLGYTPSAPLSIAAFNNPSGWTTKALKFTMEPEENLLRKTAGANNGSNIMQTVLKNVSTEIVDPEDTRHLDAQFARLDVSTDFAKSPQHWQVKVKSTDIKSEDFPAPGTHIVAPTALLNVYQTPSGGMTFDILSPETRVATDNAKIENLHIGLNGSPDDIALEYRAGSVTMVGGAVPVLPMHGTARLKSGELTGHAITNLPRTTDTPIDIHYRSVDGQGSAKILIPKIIFDPYGLQPQQLIPVLRGKLAEVTGETSAEFDFKFGDGQPVQSSGWADLKDLDVGTLVGPISGINSKLTFASIFPLKTKGIQTASMAEFDPGFPLKDGTIKFEIVPGGIIVHQAVWPIDNVEGGPGKIFLSPTNWRFGDVENRVAVNVENVGLGTMLAGIGKDKLSATGQVFGTLPARIKGVDMVIEDGVLAVKDGGFIRYKSPATDAAAARDKNAEHAFKALENFQYQQLEARIDGPLDGAMALKIVFDGKNPEVLSGQTFKFNTMVTGELANIARNMAGAFSNEENLSRIMEIKNGDQPDQP